MVKELVILLVKHQNDLENEYRKFTLPASKTYSNAIVT